jgi:hypothetical protein
MNAHTITFAPDGTASCLWTETVPLHEFGRLEVQRASTIEFNAVAQQWEVRLVSDSNTIAFSNASRKACLAWENHYFNHDLRGQG